MIFTPFFLCHAICQLICSHAPGLEKECSFRMPNANAPHTHFLPSPILVLGFCTTPLLLHSTPRPVAPPIANASLLTACLLSSAIYPGPANTRNNSWADFDTTIAGSCRILRRHLFCRLQDGPRHTNRSCESKLSTNNPSSSHIS